MQSVIDGMLMSMLEIYSKATEAGDHFVYVSKARISRMILSGTNTQSSYFNIALVFCSALKSASIFDQLLVY
jgi:hypothetical protein